MAGTGRKVEVRFGTFSCSIEGYDDPVAQLREVLQMMQQVIRETPSLGDSGPGLGDDEVARIEDALDRSAGQEDDSDGPPGIVVIRAGGDRQPGAPDDAVTTAVIPPETRFPSQPAPGPATGATPPTPGADGGERPLGDGTGAAPAAAAIFSHPAAELAGSAFSREALRRAGEAWAPDSAAEARGDRTGDDRQTDEQRTESDSGDLAPEASAGDRAEVDRDAADDRASDFSDDKDTAGPGVPDSDATDRWSPATGEAPAAAVWAPDAAPGETGGTTETGGDGDDSTAADEADDRTTEAASEDPAEESSETDDGVEAAEASQQGTAWPDDDRERDGSLGTDLPRDGQPAPEAATPWDAPVENGAVQQWTTAGPADDGAAEPASADASRWTSDDAGESPRDREPVIGEDTRPGPASDDMGTAAPAAATSEASSADDRAPAAAEDTWTVEGAAADAGDVPAGDDAAIDEDAQSSGELPEGGETPATAAAWPADEPSTGPEGYPAGQDIPQPPAGVSSDSGDERQPPADSDETPAPEAAWPAGPAADDAWSGTEWSADPGAVQDATTRDDEPDAASTAMPAAPEGIAPGEPSREPDFVTPDPFAASDDRAPSADEDRDDLAGARPAPFPQDAGSPAPEAHAEPALHPWDAAEPETPPDTRPDARDRVAGEPAADPSRSDAEAATPTMRAPEAASRPWREAAAPAGEADMIGPKPADDASRADVAPPRAGAWPRSGGRARPGTGEVDPARVTGAAGRGLRTRPATSAGRTPESPHGPSVETPESSSARTFGGNRQPAAALNIFAAPATAASAAPAASRTGADTEAGAGHAGAHPADTASTPSNIFASPAPAEAGSFDAPPRPSAAAPGEARDRSKESAEAPAAGQRTADARPNIFAPAGETPPPGAAPDRPTWAAAGQAPPATPSPMPAMAPAPAMAATDAGQGLSDDLRARLRSRSAGDEARRPANIFAAPGSSGETYAESRGHTSERRPASDERPAPRRAAANIFASPQDHGDDADGKTAEPFRLSGSQRSPLRRQAPPPVANIFAAPAALAAEPYGSAEGWRASTRATAAPATPRNIFASPSGSASPSGPAAADVLLRDREPRDTDRPRPDAPATGSDAGQALTTAAGKVARREAGVIEGTSEHLSPAPDQASAGGEGRADASGRQAPRTAPEPSAWDGGEDAAGAAGSARAEPAGMASIFGPPVVERPATAAPDDAGGAGADSVGTAAPAEAGARADSSGEPGAERGRLSQLLSRLGGRRAPTSEPEPRAPSQARSYPAAPSELDLDEAGPAGLAERAAARSVPDLLAVSAAWLTLVEGKPRFTRRDVMETFETLPGDHPRHLEARIKGFGQLVRSSTLILVDDGVFAMAQSERDRFQALIDGE